MIEYMLMNMGLLAATMGIKPEDIPGHAVVPDDSTPPKKDKLLPDRRPGIGRGLEGVTIAESFYSPIRRTDFL